MTSPSSTNWPLIVAIFLAGLGAGGQFGKIAVALDWLRAAYPGSEVMLGVMVGAVGVMGLVFGVVAGVIVDRIGARRALLAALLAGGAVSLVQALILPLPLMMASRVLEGATHLAIVVAGPVVMAQAANDRDRPTAMTIWSAFFGVAYMVIAWAGIPLMQAQGLGALWVAHGAYMIAVAALLSLLLPVQPASPPAQRLGLKGWLNVQRDIYRSPWLSAPGLGFVWYTAMYISLLAYLPGFAPEAARAGMAGAMSLGSILVSLTLGVAMLRYLPPVWVVQIGFAVVAVAALAMWIAAPYPSAYIIAATVLLSATGIIPGASFASLASLNETARGRAYATGALAQMGNVGTTTGPAVLAAIVTGFGMTGAVLFTLALCAGGIAVHAALAARRRVIPPSM